MSSNGTTKKTSEIKRKKVSVSKKRKAPSSKKAPLSSKGKTTKAKSDSKSPRLMTKDVSSRSSIPSGLKSSASSRRGQPQDKNESSSQWSHPEPMPDEHRRLLQKAVDGDGTIRTRVLGRPRKSPDEKENPYGLRLSLKQRRAYDLAAKRLGFQSWQTWLKKLGNDAAGLEESN